MAIAGRPLRVGLYTPNYPGVTQHGGIGSYTRNLAQGLSALGHQVVVLTPGQGPRIQDAGIEVQFTSTQYLPVADRLFPGAGACVRIARRMQQIVCERALDVVEFPNWEGFGLLFQRLSRTPVVVRLHTSSKETQRIDDLPATRLLHWDIKRERWQAARAAALVTHSAAHRQAMAKELGIASDRIHLIKHGVSVFPEFERAPRSVGPSTIVYVGRLEKRKGTIYLLQAAPMVLEKFPEAQFVLIGSDHPHCPGNRSHAEYLASEYPAAIRKQIHLLGPQPQAEVDRWLQTADLFVAPSLYESFGLVFPEAMRWGTPVIGTRVGGIPEIITDAETGLLVEPGQPAELAAAIIRMLSDDERRLELGRAGRRHAEANFTVERMAKATAALYAQVVGNRSKRHFAAAG